MKNVLHRLVIKNNNFLAIGLAFLTTASYSTFYSYFTEKANMMMGICQTLLVIGVTLTPYVFEFVWSSYGFRTMLWVITGLSVVTFITAGVLHPVDWHMKKVVVTEQEWESSSK